MEESKYIELKGKLSFTGSDMRDWDQHHTQARNLRKMPDTEPLIILTDHKFIIVSQCGYQSEDIVNGGMKSIACTQQLIMYSLV